MDLIKHQQQICTDLSTKGWTVLDNFFEPDLIAELARECRTQYQLGLLKQAGIGARDQRMVEKSIRSDQIRWLEPGISTSVDQFLEHIDALRHFLNQYLFLGLEECENHFAFYPPGAFYQRHLDCFQSSDARVISSVLYLNPDWTAGHGGELRLHLDEKNLDVEPVANRFVLFVSAEILHEVLPTNVDRLSLTGWFRR